MKLTQNLKSRSLKAWLNNSEKRLKYTKITETSDLWRSTFTQRFFIWTGVHWIKPYLFPKSCYGWYLFWRLQHNKGTKFNTQQVPYLTLQAYYPRNQQRCGNVMIFINSIYLDIQKSFWDISIYKSTYHLELNKLLPTT